MDVIYVVSHIQLFSPKIGPFGLAFIYKDLNLNYGIYRQLTTLKDYIRNSFIVY